MRRIPILLKVFLVAPLLCGAAGSPQSVPPMEKAAACAPPPHVPDLALRPEIDPVIDEAIALGFAGQVAIMRDGAYVYSRAAGSADKAGRIPVTPATLFHVASIAKYFTAALALRAEADGLDIHSPVSPLAARSQLAARGTTFADLLGHRSGLGSSYAAERRGSQQLALEAIDATSGNGGNAGEFRYSNDGYDLLAILLERFYKKTYESLVREKLFAPACVSNARFWGEANVNDAHVVAQPLRRVPRGLRARNYGMIGSSGLLISAESLVAWQHALKGGRVLSYASTSELMQPRGAMSLGQATYGAFLIDRPGVGKTLSARGTEDRGENAYLNDYLDCGFTVAVVTSRGPEQGVLFRDTIIEAVERAIASRCNTVSRVDPVVQSIRPDAPAATSASSNARGEVASNRGRPIRTRSAKQVDVTGPEEKAMDEKPIMRMNDFSFLSGKWLVKNRRLTERMANSKDWIEFDMDYEFQDVLGGVANLDVMRGVIDGENTDGLTIRTFDQVANEWVIYWLSSKYPRLTEQVRGRFEDGIGLFYGKEEHRGKTYKMRFRWMRLGEDHAFWDQAYQHPESGEWEVNWSMEFRRAP